MWIHTHTPKITMIWLWIAFPLRKFLFYCDDNDNNQSVTIKEKFSQIVYDDLRWK